MRSEMKRGYSSSRSVCPVGAVSITILSNSIACPRAVLASPSSTSEIILLSATSSSAPGGGTSKMSVISDSPSFDAMLSTSSDPFRLLMTALNSSIASFRSTSRAYRLPPCSATGVTFPLDRSVMSASPSECAGSVEITSVLSPSSASFTANAALVLVFPTPPFPPTMMYLLPLLSTSRCRLSSSTAILVAVKRWREAEGRRQLIALRRGRADAASFHPFLAMKG
mmetsp:Transcript_46142/g.144733  ORF Transcript_46142/g.144733 Transcript_46142/m.144733 type:complete len:225 (+) Transcript_46142:1867-2541(+)